MPSRFSKPVTVLTLAAFALVSVPESLYAQSAAVGHTGRTSSAAKRTVWALIGAGLGFGAGLMFGIRKFDDAINSDRKVWTSALVGAAIGGIAGGTLSRDAKPPFVPTQQPAFDEAVPMPRIGAGQDMALRSRVAAANQRQFSLGGGAATQAVKRDDPLWEGMAWGATAGAVVGLIIVPGNECKPENPECPRLLRIGVGIPMIAAGAALGALFDKLR